MRGGPSRLFQGWIVTLSQEAHMGGELHVLPYYLYIMNVSAMFPRRFMDVVVMSAVIGLNKREGQ